MLVQRTRLFQKTVSEHRELQHDSHCVAVVDESDRADGSDQSRTIFTILRCGQGVSNSLKNPTALMERAISSVRNRSGVPM